MRYGEGITFISESGETALFYAGRANTPYWLDDAQGLSGLSANIYTTKGSGQDGETFAAANIAKRQITLDGKILARSDQQAQLRRALMHVVRPKAAGKLVYRYGDIMRYIPCYVSQAPVFSNSYTERYQIVFDCPNPFWRDGDGTDMPRSDIAAWVPGLEFPGELTEDGAEIEYRAPSLIVNVYNGGDVPIGLTIIFRATGPTGNPELVNVGTQEYIRLNRDMLAGDEITVTTGYGEIAATLVRGGVTTNIFNDIDAGSTFLQLGLGDNLYRYYADEINSLDVSLRYEIGYMGV